MSSGEPNLHRNNAAEWVMWFALLPVYLILRLLWLLRSFVVQSLRRPVQKEV